jgi:hypothetical protein
MKRSSNRPPRQQQRFQGHGAWVRALFSTQTLLRGVGGLLVVSAIMNLFYHSHLPTPRNDHITGMYNNAPGVIVEELSHSKTSSTTLSSNSTVVSETGPRNGHIASGIPPVTTTTTAKTTPVASPTASNNSSIVWGSGAKAQQVVKTDKKGNVLHRSITQIKKEDLVGIGDDKVVLDSDNNLSPFWRMLASKI